MVWFNTIPHLDNSHYVKVNILGLISLIQEVYASGSNQPISPVVNGGLHHIFKALLSMLKKVEQLAAEAAKKKEQQEQQGNDEDDDDEDTLREAEENYFTDLVNQAAAAQQDYEDDYDDYDDDDDDEYTSIIDEVNEHKMLAHAIKGAASLHPQVIQGVVSTLTPEERAYLTQICEKDYTTA